MFAWKIIHKPKSIPDLHLNLHLNKSNRWSKTMPNSFPVNDMYVRCLAPKNTSTTWTLWLVLLDMLILFLKVWGCTVETRFKQPMDTGLGGEVEKCLARIVVIFEQLANIILCCSSQTSDNGRNDNTTTHHLIYHSDETYHLSAFRHLIRYYGNVFGVMLALYARLWKPTQWS